MKQTTVCEAIGHEIGIVNVGNYVQYPGCVFCKKTIMEIKEGR